MSQSYFLPQKRQKDENSSFSSSDEKPFTSKKPGLSLLPKIEKKVEPEQFRHFAGDSKGKLKEIFEFLSCGKYPSGFDRIEDCEKLQNKKNKLFVQARAYFISKDYVSDVSQSRFCVKNGERVVPFEDEVDQILQGLHVVDGVHLGKKKSVERAVALKIYWLGYSNEVEKFIKACFCDHSKKVQKKKMDIGQLSKKKKKITNKKEKLQNLKKKTK